MCSHIPFCKRGKRSGTNFLCSSLLCHTAGTNHSAVFGHMISILQQEIIRYESTVSSCSVWSLMQLPKIIVMQIPKIIMQPHYTSKQNSCATKYKAPSLSRGTECGHTRLGHGMAGHGRVSLDTGILFRQNRIRTRFRQSMLQNGQARGGSVSGCY